MQLPDRPPAVIDCGTGFLKYGLAGDEAPRFVEPTVLGYPKAAPGGNRGPLADLDYVVGSAALAQSSGGMALTYPMKEGIITDFDAWEKVMHHAIYRDLAIFPEDHAFILTEPPLNTPENREYTAEIMFETFDVPGLHIGVQAVLALYASWAAAEHQDQDRSNLLTGVVVDSGDGCTHIIPVVDGYVISSAIATVPLAGRDVTQRVQQLLRERGAPVPPDQSLEVARRIKEQYCYVCSDPAKEVEKVAADPARYCRQYKGISRGGAPWAVDVLHERFMGPEIFFDPHLCGRGSGWRTPLPEVIDSVVRRCPIDTRRALLGNISLSGGTTMFKHFGQRIQRDLRRAVEERTAGAGSAVQVCVRSHPMQRYAVWYGASLLGLSEGFANTVVTRQQYQEHGPSVVRHNVVYREW
ncbi:hypothetical protein ABPG77_002293 [Micractinium sp. CCAP 211/92]